MKTNLNGNDEDIKAVRIIIEIVQGYLIVKESRLGKNGKWESHEIEVMGRDYNSKEIRSEEHTSELQSRGHLVCRLLLEKKKEKKKV